MPLHSPRDRPPREFTSMSSLPLPLPSDPLPLVEHWLDEGVATGRRNADAMALATADAQNRPSVRMVLLKHFSATDGHAVFFTHYRSRKAAELADGARAAAVLYWAELGRQLRFEGSVVRSPAAESDAYFATRPWRSQLNAWASEQSKPLADPSELTRRAARQARELGIDFERDTAPAAPLPRPELWGGFRLWLDAIELWVEGADRFHERVRYTRALERADAVSFRGGAWTMTRLQP